VSDKAEIAARAILADLSDRSGIGNELDQIDDQIKEEIVATHARIIRETFAEPAVPNRKKGIQ
jgi:hypothetical protein